MGIIYIVKNKINDKVYIGQTTQKLQDRWLKHRSDSKRLDTKFYRAINKYGIENFYCEVLEENIKDELLDEKEQYWIQYYNSYKNGYNSTIGGQKYHTSYDAFNILIEWNNGLSETEISKKLNIPLDRVSRSLLHQLNITEEEINERKKNIYEKV